MLGAYGLIRLDSVVRASYVYSDYILLMAVHTGIELGL